MLSELVLGFLNCVVNSEELLETIISKYVYSERFIIALDFQVMHKKIMEGVIDSVDPNIDPSTYAVIGVEFLKRVNKSKESLDKVVCSYSEKERSQIAVTIYHIQQKLLEEVRYFLDDPVKMESESISSMEEKTNH